MNPHFADRISTPIGILVAVADERGRLVALDFDEASAPRRGELRWEAARLTPVATALQRYFAGELREFALALEPDGTPFQLRVWQELQRIPYGQTISYGELARRLGSPRAVRAVGRANGSNPIPIVIPCHRVIGADGGLTGYGGGVEKKRALLGLESRVAGGQAVLTA
jgi:methylated-DNA-[protein]-cysteine S-methyltransferase